MTLKQRLALLIIKVKDAIGIKDPFDPARKGLLYGYYGDSANDLAETHEHVNLAWIFGWPWEGDALAHAIAHLQQAEQYGITNIVLGTVAVYGPDGETWLRSYLDALNQRGLLKNVKALYPIDEPDTVPVSDATIITTNAMIRRVAAEFGLKDVKLAVIYGSRGMPGIGSYDWVGFDNYPLRETIFCSGADYDQLKAELRSDQRIILVPGGYSPFEQDPAPFYNKAQEDAQVIALVPFLWGDNVNPSLGAGIRSNATRARYIEAGTRIKTA